ncbi:EthD family reductase [Rhodopila sp.]|uniref:EthD family reductase n=1 Tax=Rhodopila sp. TaxID=2480087 RepID=UPI002BB7038F|nr:EthD family reductase [Rhodopila sp.]HVZ08266.1 EthD family reductase [Rhodopila sp.]
MIAAISMMRRQDAVPLARFRRHWLDVHGPLVQRFAGLRRYVQCHVLDSPLTTDAARSLRIDGFPILFFDDHAQRAKAQGSPEMDACNIDSRLFVGAVSRLVADVEEVMPPAASAGRISLLVMDPADPEGLEAAPRLRGLVHYRVRDQGAAPNSTVPHLAVQVGRMAQAWFDSVVDMEESATAWVGTSRALFVVEEHWLNPIA